MNSLNESQLKRLAVLRQLAILNREQVVTENYLAEIRAAKNLLTHDYINQMKEVQNVN